MPSGMKCWVPTCHSAVQGYNKKYYALPANFQTREFWIAVSGKSTESVSPEDIVFCGEHFHPRDVVNIDNNSYINKKVLFPNRNMPDRMCRICMSIISSDHTFHIISSRFPVEMPSSVKDNLSFYISSQPETLYHIFTLCMPGLKIPRDPCPLLCDECFHKIWLYFIFKVTCMEVERDLKGDMSWENYGKKVLCRSCIQTSGTNFITLSPQSSMGFLLKKMFESDPSSEIVPLRVCLACHNVLEKLDQFNKNCNEAEEKMRRHMALKQKYNQVPSTSTRNFHSLTNNIENIKMSSSVSETDLECVQKRTGTLYDSANSENMKRKPSVGSSMKDKRILAQLMLSHGYPLKSDFYQQEIWSLICQKMQDQGISCTVPGLMNVWKQMCIETKRKSELGEQKELLDDLVTEFNNMESKTEERYKSKSFRISKSPRDSSKSRQNSLSTVDGNHHPVDHTIQEKNNVIKGKQKRLHAEMVTEFNNMESKTKGNDNSKNFKMKKSSMNSAESKQNSCSAPDGNHHPVDHKIQEKNNKINSSVELKSNVDSQKRKVSFGVKSSSPSIGNIQPIWSEEMKLDFINRLEKEYNEYTTKRNLLKLRFRQGPWKTICMKMAHSRDYPECDGLFLYRIWSSLKYKAQRENAMKSVTPIGKKILDLLEKESNIHKTIQLEIDTKSSEKSVTNQGKITLNTVRIKRGRPKKINDKETNSVSPVKEQHYVSLDEKLQFVNAIIEEYELCEDQEKISKSLWRSIIRRVITKLPNLQFNKAYRNWSKLKMSALIHEKGNSDVLDNKIWKLLQKHEVFKNNYAQNGTIKNDKVSVDSNEKCMSRKTNNQDRTPEHSKKQIASLPKTSNDPKKRLSSETVTSGKKLKTEEEGVSLVKLLKKTCDEMYKGNSSSVHWPAVFKKIFKTGGYKDLTLEEVDALWSNMVFNASRNKHKNSATSLDVEVLNLLREASNNHTNEDLSSMQEVKNLKKSDRIPQLPKGLNLRSSNNFESSTSNMEHSDTDCDKVDEINSDFQKKKYWTTDEKLALISAVMKYGDLVFKSSKEEVIWPEIHKTFIDAGYRRSIIAIKICWYNLRKKALKTWANKSACSQMDSTLISFMKKFSRLDTNTVSKIEETDVSEECQENLEEKDEDGSVVHVDLTYDYVSLEDIKKMSAETIKESVIKTEYIKKNFEETDSKFILAKVEKGDEFDEINQHDNENYHVGISSISSNDVIVLSDSEEC